MMRQSPQQVWKERARKGAIFLLVVGLTMLVGLYGWMTNEHVEEMIRYSTTLKKQFYGLEAEMNELKIRLNITEFKLQQIESMQGYLKDDIRETEEFMDMEATILEEVIEKQDALDGTY